MQKIFLILMGIVIGSLSYGQNLLDLYKSGSVQLVADESYAQNNAWNQIFKTYYDTLYGKPMGMRKSLKVLPDGGVVVNHAYKNYYSKFSASGAFEKEFGVTKNDGKLLSQHKNIAGIINENTFFSTVDNIGNMLCFDFDGHYKKTLKLNYMVRQFVGLPNGKIAVVGWTIWKEKFRDFVAIIDYETNEEKIIWSYFTDRIPCEEGSKNFFYKYHFKKAGKTSMMASFSTMPFSNVHGMKAVPQIACVKSQLIVADPTLNVMHIYSLEGDLIGEKKMNLEHNKLTVDEQKDIQLKAIEKYKNMDPLRFSKNDWCTDNESKKAHQFFIEQMQADLDSIVEPHSILKPYFSTVIKDSDENLLFFEFPETAGKNVFNVWVYKNGGAFVCKSSFVCKDYELVINPDKLVFYNGYLYGLQIKKGAEGVPLRLVRFKLQPNE